jgi:hypothetical protein
MTKRMDGPEGGSQEAGLGRRDLLKVLGVGAGAAAATVVPVAVEPAAAQGADKEADRNKARYRESEHVKTFYRTNRY